MCKYTRESTTGVRVENQVALTCAHSLCHVLSLMVARFGVSVISLCLSNVLMALKHLCNLTPRCWRSRCECSTMRGTSSSRGLHLASSSSDPQMNERWTRKLLKRLVTPLCPQFPHPSADFCPTSRPSHGIHPVYVLTEESCLIFMLLG